jgi:hypothetical protein
MNLSEAEVVVTTQQEMDNDPHSGDWFLLSDYGDMGEFYTACCMYFSQEKNPVFRYPEWENIPDCLITKEWFCPNFFEIRDAMERLDEPETDYFMTWCNYHGHNIAVDDPHLLVSYYQDNNCISYSEYESETMDLPGDTFTRQSITGNFFDTERYPFEMFEDNYD